MDILDDRVSLRRMWNLIQRLPAHAELWAERGHVERVDRIWSTSDYLLANVIDLLQIQAWQFAAANSKHAPRKPKPVKRPRDAAPTQRPAGHWPGRTIVVPKG